MNPEVETHIGQTRAPGAYSRVLAPYFAVFRAVIARNVASARLRSACKCHARCNFQHKEARASYTMSSMDNSADPQIYNGISIRGLYTVAYYTRVINPVSLFVRPQTCTTNFREVAGTLDPASPLVSSLDIVASIDIELDPRAFEQAAAGSFQRRRSLRKAISRAAISGPMKVWGREEREILAPSGRAAAPREIASATMTAAPT